MNWSGMPVWASFLVMCVIAEIAKALLLRRLKYQHPYAWDELGQPNYFSKSSFDILGRLTPYLRNPDDPIARDEKVRRLVVLRRASWWTFTIAFVGVWLLGRGNLLTIYRNTKPPPSGVLLALAGITSLVIIAISWRTSRRRD